MSKVVAVIVGVAEPAAFIFRRRSYAFRTAQGVQGDVDWYRTLLSQSVPRERLSLTVLTSSSDTMRQPLLQRLGNMVDVVQEGDLFVLVLIGHGFQVTDDNGDEKDGKDEVFAAKDGAVADDDFARLWTRLPESARLLAIVDTCSADSLGLLGGAPPSEHVRFTVTGPARLSIAASMSAEEAGTVLTRHGPRGQLSLALETAWRDENARGSYLKWFRAAAQHVSLQRPQQHPQLRFVGPNRSLLDEVPFSP